MYTKPNVTQLILRYGLIGTALVGENILDSDNFINSKQLAENLLNKLIPYCDDFIGIIKGYVDKCEILGFIRTMSFPKRFSKLGLSEKQKKELEDILEQTFFLGLTFHFFSWNMPTRKEADKVNFDSLISNWLIKIMLADKHCKSYNKDMNNMPKSFFNYYYDRLLEPFFQNELQFGYLKRGACYAYFHNLFYSGVLLGVHFDVATSQIVNH